jgi:hypothetical protein
MLNQIFHWIIDWSEVWALLIPLIVLLLRRRQPSIHYPVIIYVLVAILLNVAIDVMWKFKYSLPANYRNNNILYNIHSLTRLLLFSWFFILLNQPSLTITKKVLPVIFVIFFVINFSYFESIFYISSRLFTIEAATVLVFCLQYFLFLMQTDSISVKIQPGFWIVTGLSIYMAASFFIFLFYRTLANNYKNIAFVAWDIHNFFYIILCLFIAKAFYESKR